MRKLVLLVGLGACFSGVYAAATLDLSDFDQEAMPAIDETKKDLESYIAGKEGAAARQSAEFIRDGLQWTEDYFARKGGATDAVELARQGRGFAEQIARSAAANDFDAAYEAYNGLLRTCKKCHDTYKPPDL